MGHGDDLALVHLARQIAHKNVCRMYDVGELTVERDFLSNGLGRSR